MRFIQLVFLLNIMFTSTAHAYLDPTTGSYIVQILMAFFLGVLFILKTFRNKLTLFFKSFFNKKSLWK